MNFKILLLIPIVIVAQMSFAQESPNDKPEFEFGLQHAFNLATLPGTIKPERYGVTLIEYKPVSPRFTMDFGMFGTFYTSNKFAIQVEALYTYLGADMKKITSTLHHLGRFPGEEEETFAMNYLKFPISVVFFPNRNFFFQLGGYASAMISSSTLHIESGFLKYDRQRKELEGINKFDAGLVAGLGINTGGFRVSFRYSRGLVDVFKDNNHLDLKHSVFQLVTNFRLTSSY